MWIVCKVLGGGDDGITADIEGKEAEICIKEDGIWGRYKRPGKCSDKKSVFPACHNECLQMVCQAKGDESLLNDRQVAFIICVNNERKYEECRYYLERLRVPDGYGTDVIRIQGAPSMAAGYNAGMAGSDAKYKVYMHQDVLIHNVNFIPDLLAVFACDAQIGLLGMVGTREKSPDGLMRWERGKVVDYYGIHDSKVSPVEKSFEEVDVADGLLLATQYDIPWREELFDGWHFYDLSQCMEFRKAGYKVAVPCQERSWCYHDTTYPDMRSYWEYYERFVHEYAGIPGFPFAEKTVNAHNNEMCREYADGEVRLYKEIEQLFDLGGKTELRKIFLNPDFRSQVGRKEYQSIVYIDWLEEENQSEVRFWEEGMTADGLLSRLQDLKYLLKRIEWGAAEGEEEKQIESSYSKYAVMEACSRYVYME